MTFPFPYITRGGVRPLGIELVTSRTISSSETSFTFSDTELGTPDPNRIIAVALNAQGGSAVPNTLRQLDAKDPDAGRPGDGFGGQWGATTTGIHLWQHPIGTLGEVSLNFGSSKSGCTIDVFAIYGADMETFTSDSSFESTSSSRTLNLTVSNPSVSLGLCVRSASDRNITWSHGTRETNRSPYGGGASSGSTATWTHEAAGSVSWTATVSGGAGSIVARAINLGAL